MIISTVQRLRAPTTRIIASITTQLYSQWSRIRINIFERRLDQEKDGCVTDGLEEVTYVFRLGWKCAKEWIWATSKIVTAMV